MSFVSDLSGFNDKLEQKIRDLKSDYKIEPLTPDDDFLNEIVTSFNEMYKVASDAEDRGDQVTELKEVLQQINDLTRNY